MPLFGGLPDAEKLKAKGNVKGLIKALGYMRDAEDMVVKIESERLRQAAAEALGQIGDARAVEPLIAALKDPWTDVRRAAARALGQIGDAQAVEPLLVAGWQGPASPFSPLLAATADRCSKLPRLALDDVAD